MKKFILLFILFILLPQKLSAAGLFVNPSKLFVQTTTKHRVYKELTIKNISLGPLIYNLYSDELSEMITINPSIFRLEPTEEQKIKITIKPTITGTLITNISIVAQEIDRRKFNADAGVKIPLEIIALPEIAINYSKFLIGKLFGLIIIIGLIIILIRQKKKKSLKQKILYSVNLLKNKNWWSKLFNR